VDLATYSRNEATTDVNENFRFILHPKLTPIQSRAFQLLGIDPDRTQ
jgi:hypothetical protein